MIRHENPLGGIDTCPEMQPIKAIGIEVIADPIAAPALAASRVWAVALAEGPAHPQVSGLCCQKWSHLIHHHFKVPFAILCGALCSAHKDVGADAAGETGQEGWRGEPGGGKERDRETSKDRGNAVIAKNTAAPAEDLGSSLRSGLGVKAQFKSPTW